MKWALGSDVFHFAFRCVFEFPCWQLRYWSLELRVDFAVGVVFALRSRCLPYLVEWLSWFRAICGLWIPQPRYLVTSPLWKLSAPLFRSNHLVPRQRETVRVGHRWCPPQFEEVANTNPNSARESLDCLDHKQGVLRVVERHYNIHIIAVILFECVAIPTCLPFLSTIIVLGLCRTSSPALLYVDVTIKETCISISNSAHHSSVRS